MKSNFIIFFSIVFVVWTAVNSYVFFRGLSFFSYYPKWKLLYIIGFWFLAYSFFIGRIIENYSLNFLTEFLICVGSFYMAMLLYFLIAVLLIDIFRIFNHFFHFLPAFTLKVKQIIFFSTIAIVLIVSLIGYINAANPRLKEVKIKINKKVENLQNLNVLIASDVHLGTLIGKGHLHKFIKTAEELKPDLILFAGDIIDEDIAAVIKENIGEELLKLNAKYGIYGILGNHEYIGGVDDAYKYLTEHNIQILRDTAIKINNSFYIIGRDDRARQTMFKMKRKELTNILSENNIDKSLPTILMDHQPFNLNEAANNDIDIQISGHTHHGQLWPFNYITNSVYEVSRGYHKIKNTHYYVSVGYGTWGPKVRIGNTPEIVNLKIEFEK